MRAFKRDAGSIRRVADGKLGCCCVTCLCGIGPTIDLVFTPPTVSCPCSFGGAGGGSMDVFTKVVINNFPTTWNITSVDCLGWTATGGEAELWQAPAFGVCGDMVYIGTVPITVGVTCDPGTGLLTIAAGVPSASLPYGVWSQYLYLLFTDPVAPDVFANNLYTDPCLPGAQIYAGGGGVTASQA